MAEHLFAPEGTPQKPLLVEYRGPVYAFYDVSDWTRFPARYGWEVSATDPPGSSPIPSRYHSGVECWLYFGMLHYIFGPDFSQSDFLLKDEEEYRQYITTRNLHKYVENSKEWKKKGFGPRTIEIVNLVAAQIRNERIASCVRADMGFLIRVLCTSLWDVATIRDGPQIENMDVRSCKASQKWEYRQMLKEGWCLLEIEKAQMMGSVLAQAYMLQLSRPGISAEFHRSCKETECVANNINEEEYMTRHVSKDCECSHIHVEVEKLHTILEEGGVPLVAMTPSADGGVTLDIVKKRPGKRYVSISHVWSDGLGNTNGNSLPSCQLKLLFDKAGMLLSDKEYVPRYEGVYGPLHTATARLAHFAGSQALFGKKETVHLWIDTLCIPHRRDVRKLAIQRIREVYLNAYRTMILDSEMRQIDSEGATNFELLQRVQICSGWMRRAWTLQEGLAAKSKLYVLFKNRAINISTIADELLTKIDGGKIPVLLMGMVEAIMSTWFTFFEHSIAYASKFERFVDFVAKPINFDGSLDPISPTQLIAWNWFNIAMRAATRPEDRPIIFAGILNLDVKKILDEKGADDRMRKLYSLLDEFPEDVIFQTGPRFEEMGLRWALKSCQYTSTIRYLQSDPGELTPQGLKVTGFPSWIFLSNDAVDLHQHETPPKEWAEEIEISPSHLVLRLKTKDPVSLEPNTEYGIIVDAKQQKGRTAPRVYDRQFTAIGAALVKVQKESSPNVAAYESVGYIKSVSNFGELPDTGYLVRVAREDLQVRPWLIG